MDFRHGARWSAFSKFGDPYNEADAGSEAGTAALLSSKAGLEPLHRQSTGSPRFLDSIARALEMDDAASRGRQQLERPYTSQDDGSAPQQPAAAAVQSARIIMPDGAFRQMWMHIQLAVAMYIVWVTPVRVGFNIPSEGMWFWFEGMIDMFFYFDLALNFFTAYEDPVSGDLVTSHRAIAFRYLRSWFVVDLLATFPVDYIVRAVEGTWMCSLRGDCLWTFTSDSNLHMISLLRLLRFFRVVWILKHVKFMRFSVLLGGLADDLYTILPALSILELVIVLIYLGHISGCFFYLLSTPPWQTAHEKSLIASGEITTWMQHAFGGDKVVLMPAAFNHTAAVAHAAGALPPTATQDPASGAWWVCPDFGYSMTLCPGCSGPHMRCESHYRLAFRYVTSMYWAYTTMTTVGYGDISSTTLAEKLWAITTMIVSGFFFSFVVGRMASLVSKLDSHRTAYNERLEVVTTFLKDTNLPRHLSKRVLDMFRKQKIKPYDRQQVLGILPFELKAKILRHLYSGAIHSVPLLNKMAHDDLFLTDVCIRLQPYNCSAKTFVYQRGETGGDVFILMRGELQLLDMDRNTFVSKVSEGSVFGEGTVLRHLEGFLKAKRTENMWCKTPCNMLRIAQEDMSDLLDQYSQLLDTLRSLNRSRHHEKSMLRYKNAPAAVQLSGGADSIPAVRSANSAAVLPREGCVDLASSCSWTELAAAGAGEAAGGLGSLPGPRSMPDLQQLALMSRAVSTTAASTKDLAGLGAVAEQQQQQQQQQQAGSSSSASLSPPQEGAAEIASLPSQQQLQQLVQVPGTLVGPAAVQQLLQEQVQRLSRMVAEQHSAVMEEVQFQRYMIHQVPGRVMNHMSMVLAQPSPDQRRALEESVEQMNRQQRWL